MTYKRLTYSNMAILTVVMFVYWRLRANDYVMVLNMYLKKKTMWSLKYDNTSFVV